MLFYAPMKDLGRDRAIAVDDAQLGEIARIADDKRGVYQLASASSPVQWGFGPLTSHPGPGAEIPRSHE